VLLLEPKGLSSLQITCDVKHLGKENSNNVLRLLDKDTGQISFVWLRVTDLYYSKGTTAVCMSPTGR
jgi:hypothetical protein